MTPSTTQPELHSSPSLLSLFLPAVALTGVTAPPCISSSDAACIATSSYGYTQPELRSSPPPCPLPSPRLCFSESGLASSSMTPSYQQIPPVPMFDGTSLHARGISQLEPSFNASGNIVSTDLDVVVSSPIATLLSSLDDQQQQHKEEAQPASATSSAGMILGQTANFFGLAQSTSTKQPLSFVSSFDDPMHGVPFLDLEEAPAVSQSQLTMPLESPCSQQQQQQPARASSSLAPSLILGQSDRFAAGFRPSTSETRPSSRSAGLPPRWRPPRSRIDTTTTFGYMQQSSDSKLAPLPPSLQTPPSPPVEQAAPTGSETPGQEACRSSFMDSAMVSAMPNLSIGASGSGGKLFTDTEMEKIRKEERLSHLMKMDPKRVRRTLSNRESGKKSKERKENHRVGLELWLRELEIEREILSRQAKLQKEALAEAASQNRMLNTRLQGLEQELKLKEELNEAFVSRIQNLKPANLSSSSSFCQEMSLAGGQCSNMVYTNI